MQIILDGSKDRTLWDSLLAPPTDIYLFPVQFGNSVRCSIFWRLFFHLCVFPVYIYLFLNLQAVIHIRHSKVNELPLNSEDPAKYLFEIVPRKHKSKNNNTSAHICQEFLLSCQNWMRASYPASSSCAAYYRSAALPSLYVILIFAGSTVDRERCPYVFMANSQTDMEEWVRVLRRVTGVPNGGLVKLHVLKEPQELQFQTALDTLAIFLNPVIVPLYKLCFVCFFLFLIKRKLQRSNLTCKAQ